MEPLYKMVAQYRELQALDLEDIDEQTLADTLEGLGGEITVKSTNVALFARNIETFADTIESAATAMQARAERFRRKAAGIRDYLKNQMIGAQITKIEAPEFTIRVQNNPVAVFIETDAKIPERFMVTPPPAPPPVPRPDKTALKKALEAGEAIDGCRLERGTRLVIK